MGNETNIPSRPKPEDGKTLANAAETACSNPDTPPGAASPAPQVNSADWVGRTLGKYKIEALLGQGGMGIVLKGRDPLIERDVAIKVLAAQLGADETARSRFLAEARAVGKLNHPNVAAIYEVGQEGASCFLVMEFIPGGSLSDQLEKEGPLTVLDATRALSHACRGVAAAHASGLIHRDLKPANLMRAADGAVKVMDFGLAKGDDSTRHLTQTGVIMGTPFFMSPEQCEARPVDARCDIYSLGATYYALLTGMHPYQDSGSVLQLMYRHVHAAVPDPRLIRADVPAACAQIVARAMAKAAGDRYQSAEQMLADLQAVSATLSGQAIALPSLSGPHTTLAAAQAPVPSGPRRRWPVVAALAAGLAVLAVVLLVWRPWETSTAPAIVPSSGEPIRIGVLHSQSGTMSASELPVIDATRLAVDEINKAGGLLGRPVEVVVADGRSDEAVFAEAARRLITRDKVVTIFGCWTSASRKAVKPVVEEHDHLLVYPLQYEGLEASSNIMYMGAAPNQQIVPAVEWAVKNLGKKRFFLVGSDYIFPRTANAIIGDVVKRLGVETCGELYLPLGSADVGPLIEAIDKARPDMILNTINGDSNVAFFRALRARYGAKDLPALSFSLDELQLRSLNPAQLQGDYAAWTYFQAIASPENERFLGLFRAKHPDEHVTDPMATAYVGVKLWAKAVADAGSVDPTRIRRAMLNQRLTAPEGEVRLDPDTQHCVKTPRIGQVQGDGTFKVIWTAPAPVAPDPYPSSRSAEKWRDFLHDLYTGWGKRWSAPSAGELKK